MQNTQRFQNRPFQNLLGDKFGAKTGFKKPALEVDRFSNKFSLPNIDTLGSDGVDHINIYSLGETDLGVALSQHALLQFNHNRFGPFLTVEGLWYWLRSVNGDDSFRNMKGNKARNYSKTIENHTYVPNFKYFIIDATLQKIKAYPELLKAVKESELRFDCYYYYKGKDGHNNNTSIRIRPVSAGWIIAGMNAIREALQRDQEPDLEFLIDNKAELDKLDEKLRKTQAPVFRKPKKSNAPVAEAANADSLSDNDGENDATYHPDPHITEADEDMNVGENAHLPTPTGMVMIPDQHVTITTDQAEQARVLEEEVA